MPPLDGGGATGRDYWRSLQSLAATPEFQAGLEEEFPGGVEVFSRTSRRHFMKVMAASLAMAGLASCRWPKEEILPFANRPDGRVPGQPQQFATAFELGGVASGLLVTSYDGRPVKVEGNPAHPQNRGAARAIDQALVLEMYDPDRSRVVRHRAGGREERSSWRRFEAWAGPHFAALKSRGGAGLRVLGEASASPALEDLRRRFAAAFPEARWHEYEALSRDHEREGSRLAFGQPCRAHLALRRAEVIVSLEGDFLDAHPASVQYARDFAATRRAAGGRMSRLHVLEAPYSLTGGMADHRHPLSSSEVTVAACQLATALMKRGLSLAAVSAGVRQAIARLGAKAVARPFIADLAAELLAHRGRGLVVAGPRQPAAVHALVHVLNVALGNAGQTVTFAEEPGEDRPTHVESIRSLAAAMERGAVTTLLVVGGNPAFDAPADLDFAVRLGRVPTSLHLSLYDNETSRRCTWSLPRAQALEAWGDARSYDGAHTLVQPLIAPLYDGRTPLEVLAMVLDDRASEPGPGERVTRGYKIVRRTFRALHGDEDFEVRWRTALHRGVVDGTRFRPVPATLRPATDLAARLAGLAAAWQPPAPGAYEVVLAGDPKLHDGRFANLGWLQELPEPVTKITWDNAALISPAAARELGIERHGTLLGLAHEGRELELPAFIQPGQAAASVVVWLGQGREAGGRVANGVGVNTYPFRTSGAMDVVRGVRVAVRGGRRRLATTQDHHAMDTRVGRRSTAERVPVLIREGTLAEYREHPDFARHRAPEVEDVALWQEHRYDQGYRWGMSIDLTACTGCSACVVACQAENNIPVVGKDEVSRGREMHWLRIDRYYQGDPASPALAHQPVPCMQCENAPCEQVCPVGATLHSAEGLNDMVYNRCIGTRYCLNNCPFKVRRFNWFLNHRDQTEVEKMRHNPEVTLRSRGVMEKCTYCVQRLSRARIAARNDGRRLRDGDVTPACAQTCPTGAITFGDLNDPASRVAKLQASGRSYGLLDELRVKPRTRYLARLKNPARGEGGGH